MKLFEDVLNHIHTSALSEGQGLLAQMWQFSTKISCDMNCGIFQTSGSICNVEKPPYDIKGFLLNELPFRV